MRLPISTTSISISDIAHTALNAAFPILSVALVFFDLTPLAIIMVLISKWRIFAVKPFYWFVNLRASAIDIIVGVSSILLISESFKVSEGGANEMLGIAWVAIWTLLYILWLFNVKPKTSLGAREIQTLWAVIIGSWALITYSQDISSAAMVVYFWLIGLSSARHFLASREERFVNGISFIWGALFVQMGWVLSQWIHIYSMDGLFEIPQGSILIGVASFVSMRAYMEYREDKPSLKKLRPVLLNAAIIFSIAMLTTDWSGIG